MTEKKKRKILFILFPRPFHWSLPLSLSRYPFLLLPLLLVSLSTTVFLPESLHLFHIPRIYRWCVAFYLHYFGEVHHSPSHPSHTHITHDIILHFHCTMCAQVIRNVMHFWLTLFYLSWLHYTAPAQSQQLVSPKTIEFDTCDLRAWNDYYYSDYCISLSFCVQSGRAFLCILHTYETHNCSARVAVCARCGSREMQQTATDGEE